MIAVYSSHFVTIYIRTNYIRKKKGKIKEEKEKLAKY